MRTKHEIFKGMDETLFFLKCKLSFKFFVDNVVGLPIEKHQVDWVHDVENNSRTCIIAFTGSGKCLKKGTKVIMYDGSLKCVEDVKIGDKLMGDDSTQRTVLNTNSGFGKMYKISQLKGNDYYVNEDHILSLKYTNCNVKSVANKYIDISISDYLKLGKSKKQWLKGYKVPIDFKEQQIDLDPYFLGCWLGDGRNDNQTLCLSDYEIANFIYKYANEVGYNVSEYKQGSDKCKGYSIVNKMGAKNHIKELLRKYNLLHNKHIPDLYKLNTRKIRLQVLAGLLDTDGYHSGTCLDFVFKEKQLAEDITYLCRSLGFHAKITKCKKGIKSTGFVGDYYRITVSGNLDEIPNLVKRKHPSKRKINKNPLVCGVTVSESEDAEWFGFALDGNKKFLLDDFTVTHNSECLGIWYPLWKMSTTPGWQGLIVSNSMGQGTKLLERVMDMVNDNEVLIDLKGARDKENSTQFNTRHRCKLFCMPNTKNVKSVHVDYVLADEASAYDDHDVFFRFVETRANAKQGRLCAISTLTSPDDLMGKLRDNPAYKTIITSCYNPDRSALSVRFPLEYLEGKKLSMGIDAFRKEYECDVSMVLDAIFPPDLIISCFDNNIGFSLNKDDFEGTAYIGCDFAYSAQGDYSVFLVLDVTDTRIVIRHMERYRGMAIDEQKQRILALNQMLDPASIVVDASNFGQGIFKDLLAEGVPVYGQNFAPINRRTILINLKTKMESGKVIIPHIEDGNTERLIDILKMELSSFKRKNTQAGFETFQAESKHDDCLSGDTLIKTKRGWIKIKDVVVGDLVLTHKNRYRKVINNNKRKIRPNEKMYSLISMGRPDIRITGNHELYVSKKKYNYKHEPINNNGVIVNPNCVCYCEKEWVAIDKVDINKYGSMYPITKNERNYTIDLLKYAPKSYVDEEGELVSYMYSPNTAYTKIKNPKSNNIKRRLKVDNFLGLILGYFAAEGTTGKHNVSFASHKKETGIRNYVNNWFKELGSNVSIHTIRNSTVSSIGSVILCNFFKSNFSKGTTKKYPKFVESLPIEIQRNILIGHAIGDGCFTMGYFTLATVSRIMAFQLFDMFTRCGYIVSIKKRRGQVCTLGSGCCCNDMWCIRMSIPEANKFIESIPKELLVGKTVNKKVIKQNQTQIKSDKSYIYSTIKNITEITPTKLVYNLHVDEDESYVANGYIVHNCVIALALAIKAAENHQPFLSFMATERRPLGKNEKGLGGLIATS